MKARGPGDQAFGQTLPHPEIAAADVTHGGEAAFDHVLGAGKALQGHQRHRIVRTLRHRQMCREQVDVRVDQAGQQRLAACVDLDIGRQTGPPRGNLADGVTLDHDIAVGDQVFGMPVEDGRVADDGQ